ncbi:MAG: glycosyltransferase family 2 protein [Acidobacteria bacterium]|nr:glycosyltransferase family 2 protein [Acidobacteriota bacterium]
MSSRPSISVFFPAYNDAGTIPSMVLMALLTLRRIADDYEVIVVNDGSQDYTPQLLEELASFYPEVRVIHHLKNVGYGGALRTGIAQSRKELIFYTDGDAQYDVRELEKLLSMLTEGVDMVNGYKISRSDPFYRSLLGATYQLLMKLLFGIRIRDIDCDFRLMRRSIFDKISLKSDTGAICVEMVKKIEDSGFTIIEVPVHHLYRSYGKSQHFTFRRLLQMLVNLAKLWYELFISPPSPAEVVHDPEHFDLKPK